MKTVLLSILSCVLGLVVITGLLFYFGVVGNIFDSTVTKQHMNIERNNFEQSQSYVDGKLQDLAKQKLEYDKSTDPTAKQAILSYVNSNFADFDINKVTDPALANFLLKARGE